MNFYAKVSTYPGEKLIRFSKKEARDEYVKAQPSAQPVSATKLINKQYELQCSQDTQEPCSSAGSTPSTSNMMVESVSVDAIREALEAARLKEWKSKPVNKFYSFSIEYDESKPKSYLGFYIKMWCRHHMLDPNDKFCDIANAIYMKYWFSNAKDTYSPSMKVGYLVLRRGDDIILVRDTDKYPRTTDHSVETNKMV